MKHHHQAPPDLSACDNRMLGSRLRLIRLEIFGQANVVDFVGPIGLPARSWLNYEEGVAIPGHVLLAFLDITGAEPRWLLTGLGSRYRLGRVGPEATC